MVASGKPLRPDQIQSPDDPVRNLAEKREAAIARSVASALSALGDIVNANRIEGMIARGDWAGIGRILDGDEVRAVLGDAYRPVIALYQDSAEREFDKYKGTLPLDIIGLLLGAVPLRDQFVSRVVAQGKTVIGDQVVSLLRQGYSPSEVARMLQGVIGLNAKQAKAVDNYRRALLGGDRAALSRALRDRRFDATVEQWIAGNAPVDVEKAEAMAARYAERLLTHRAETVARTEAIKAANYGLREAYVQAVQSGRLLDSEVKRFWLTAGDERVCPICASIPVMNEKGVSVLKPYASVAGPIMVPTAHTNCRCTEKYVADLSRVQETPFEYPLAA